MARPAYWTEPEQLQKRIDEYYQDCRQRGVALTFAGLAAFLEVDRKTIYNYGQKDAFFPTIKKAKQKIEASWEEHSFTKDANASSIFVMKNYGYTDRQEIDTNIKGDFSEALNKFIDKV